MKPAITRLIPVDKGPRLVEQRIEGRDGQSVNGFIREQLGWIAGTMLWWGCTQSSGMTLPHKGPIITIYHGDAVVHELGYRQLIDSQASDAHNSMGDYRPTKIVVEEDESRR